MELKIEQKDSARFFVRNFFFIAFPVAFVVMLLGCVTIWLADSNTKNNVKTGQEQTVGRIKEGMDVIFSEANAQSLNYSVSSYIMVKLRTLLEDGYLDKQHLDIDYMIKPFLDSNVNGKPFLHSEYVYLNNENGNFFASGVGLANKLNHNDAGWLELAAQKEKHINQWLEPREISTHLKSSYITDVLALHKRLYASGYAEPIGILVLNIRTDYLEDFLEGFLMYESQSILMLDRDGRILCQAGKKLTEDELRAENRETLERFYDIASRENQEYEVTYLSLVPQTDMNVMAAHLGRVIWFFILLALLIGMVLAYLTTSRNAANVNRLNQLLNLAQRGESIPEIPKKQNDEYSYIIQSVVKNYVEKQNLQMQLAERKHRLDNMYYSFLQSQLSPHFLFNTLKNIFWRTMELTGGPSDTSRMLDRLTNLLYYALVRPDKFVTVSEEIKMTVSYLEIQQLRFDYQFHTIWEYEPEVEQCRTIKFVLQPLVDNSISHGFEELTGEGELLIRIQKEGERLWFLVEDNGSGMQQEQRERIQKNLEQEETPADGTGLYNLNKRLVLTYGAEAAVHLESQPGVYTRVSFSIPVK